jgi:formylmethanofuran dehydrogenase subunit E
MPLKVRLVYVDQTGHIIPDTDNKMYDIKCSKCGRWHAEGSGRYGGQFLCDACLRETVKSDVEGG